MKKGKSFVSVVTKAYPLVGFVTYIRASAVLAIFMFNKCGDQFSKHTEEIYPTFQN